MEYKEGDFVLVRARVTQKNEEILTLKLEDGGGNAEVVVRADRVAPLASV